MGAGWGYSQAPIFFRFPPPSECALQVRHRAFHFFPPPQLTYITSILPTTRQQDTGRTLRNANIQTLLVNRTVSFQKSFVPATTKLWNSLPNHIRTETSLKSFKKALIRHLATPPPPRYFSLGTKIGNKLHTRLRVGTSRLNSHLYPIQLSESLQCKCGSPNETVHHFVLNCPLYQNARDSLFESLRTHSQVNINASYPSELLNMLLHGPNTSSGEDQVVAYLFQNFLRDSGRFN